jgi:hypothetical protein
MAYAVSLGPRLRAVPEAGLLCVLAAASATSRPRVSASVPRHAGH